ncbi:MAG: hypothetical protein RBR02_09875 [Desulfuromonadaceae bacterium]|nr:hypothetical protein [Desulfuromonadaceae bacterium]
MIPESLTATGLVSAAQPVVSAFGDVLALVLTLGLGFFVVMYIIAQARAITRDLEVLGYGRGRRPGRHKPGEYDRMTKRGYEWTYDSSGKGGGYWQKPRR